MPRSSIYLTNSRKHYCSLCKCDLTPQEKIFFMSQIGGAKLLTVTDELLFCPSCNRYYVTQEMCRLLVEKHPGYYLNASLLKDKKKKSEKAKVNTEIKAASPQPVSLNTSNKTTNNQQFLDAETTYWTHLVADHKTPSGINANVLLTNTAPITNNTCPICRSILGKEAVNVPVIDNNGDFIRYYLYSTPYCYKCRKAYMSKSDSEEILSRINSHGGDNHTIGFENATIQRGSNSRDFLYRPSLNNNEAVFSPNTDYFPGRATRSDSLSLNETSFLGELGYTVSKDQIVRRRILDTAVKQFGKRRVCDHLAFLITTRRAQEDGEKRFANALAIWQSDLNYVSSLL